MNLAQNSLYELFGIDLHNDEQQYLLINDQTALIFEETDEGLRVICPVSLLPDDVYQLRQVLRYNYATPVIFASNTDDSLLMALLDIPEECDVETLKSLVEQLVTMVLSLRSQLNLSPYMLEN
ncbi:MAG: hypothetical protein ACRC5A_03670 [Enterobacteriaceae bacterium]